ncbi:MAG TPA: peptide chain release factor N(5)-glutamine methyltransferase, partial [Ignavibacteriales bacterium]|nr:peptide chain release factor N(5)-glutamine methyltransferase [Ignavibacteriales bacterium]
MTKKGIESPRLNAELMLAYILNCKRFDLYLRFDQPLTELETTQYREALRRRGEFEPLQYITGRVEFYGLDLKVNKSVLIPRPETEILVETILKLSDKTAKLKILDIGSGSGNIPIALAKNLPEAELTAIDISDEALQVAEENAVSNLLENRISFIKMDALSDFTFPYKFDIIVSNPPYVSSKDFSGLQKEIIGYEPKQAVTDNSDGLMFYRAISAKVKDLLNGGGKLFFEIGMGQSADVEGLMKNYFSDINIIKDF